MNRKKIKAGPGKQGVAGEQFRLAQEIKSIQRRALNTMPALLPLARWRCFRPKLGPSPPNKTQIPPLASRTKSQKLLPLTDRSEERAQRAVERKIPLPSRARSEA